MAQLGSIHGPLPEGGRGAVRGGQWQYLPWSIPGLNPPSLPSYLETEMVSTGHHTPDNGCACPTAHDPKEIPH